MTTTTSPGADVLGARHPRRCLCCGGDDVRLVTDELHGHARRRYLYRCEACGATAPRPEQLIKRALLIAEMPPSEADHHARDIATALAAYYDLELETMDPPGLEPEPTRPGSRRAAEQPEGRDHR